jgi:hypothetical protein
VIETSCEEGNYDRIAAFVHLVCHKVNAVALRDRTIGNLDTVCGSE